jgi:hypothetical protein
VVYFTEYSSPLTLPATQRASSLSADDLTMGMDPNGMRWDMRTVGSRSTRGVLHDNDNYAGAQRLRRRVCLPQGMPPGASQARWRAGTRCHARVARALPWPPSSYDWSRTRARRRGGEALERVSEGDWPSASVVTRVFGNWAAAREAVDAEAQSATGPS